MGSNPAGAILIGMTVGEMTNGFETLTTIMSLTLCVLSYLGWKCVD